MKFPVILTADEEDGGFVVTFPDIPEAITQGETREEALEMAKEALGLALEFYFDDKRAVPLPSTPLKNQDTVELDASFTAKVNREGRLMRVCHRLCCNLDTKCLHNS